MLTGWSSASDWLRSLPIARFAPLSGRILADLAKQAWAVIMLLVIGAILGFRVGTGPLGVLAAFGLVLVSTLAISWALVLVAMLAASPEKVQIFCLGLGRTGHVDPAEALRQIAFELERDGAPTYRVQAFRRAARVLGDLPAGELERRIEAGTLRALKGIGDTTAQVITEAAGGARPSYLARLVKDRPPPERDALRAALRGDCHTHSDWSDGGSPPREMAEAARELGHEWIALTDHSPRLTVANGLSAERLRAQLKLIGQLNEELAPFRILTGIEVDILEDGSLDQREDLLRQLDLVVASVHSKLRMPAGPMTRRMVAAVRNPHVTVLGHCTGRLLSDRQDGRRRRPESDFDPEAVFGACQEAGVAVEINCRPEREDPPDRLLRLAAEVGCLFAIDTDAHAPGQLDWLGNGTVRAEQAGITADRVINTRGAEGVASVRSRR